MKFSDWVLARESSSFTRLRQAAALGLMPPIPDAAINSRSTASPFEQKSLKGKGSKKKRRKKKVDKPINKSIDAFVKASEDLKKDIDNLEKKRKEQNSVSSRRIKDDLKDLRIDKVKESLSKDSKDKDSKDKDSKDKDSKDKDSKDKDSKNKD